MGQRPRISDEQILQAITDNPSLSGRKLAELLGLSSTNRITRLREANPPAAPPPPPVPRLNWKAFCLSAYSYETRRLIRSIAVESLARGRDELR